LERRKALATAASVTLFVGTGIVAAATVGHVPLVHGSTGPSNEASAPDVVTRYRDVYDRIVVAGASTKATPAASGARRAAGASTHSSVSTPGGASTTPTTAPARAKRGSTPTTRRTSSTPTTHTTPTTGTSGTTTPPTTTPATLPVTTPTTRPPGVPSDWPAWKPIPPMPPGCQKPELEDNGVWNCDH
jgi:hypothetical protein